MAETNSVLMLFRDGDGQQRGSFGLGLGELVDELGLDWSQ